METQTQLKICKSCSNELPYYSFGVDRNSPCGFNGTCKSCRNIKRKYSYRNESVDLNQLPRKMRNKEILKSLKDNSTFPTESGHIINFQMTEMDTKIRVMKNDVLILGLDIQDFDFNYLREIILYHLDKLQLTLITP